MRGPHAGRHPNPVQAHNVQDLADHQILESQPREFALFCFGVLLEHRVRVAAGNAVSPVALVSRRKYTLNEFQGAFLAATNSHNFTLGPQLGGSYRTATVMERAYCSGGNSVTVWPATRETHTPVRAGALVEPFGLSGDTCTVAAASPVKLQHLDRGRHHRPAIEHHLEDARGQLLVNYIRYAGKSPYTPPSP